MNFIILKEAQEYLELTWGTPQGQRWVPPAGEVLAAARGRPSPWRAPPSEPPPTLSLFHSKNHPPLFKPKFLLFGAGIFDLFAQPIILAEFW